MAHNKRITIQDIADRAQVSKSTVSRVLNDSTPVAPEKRAAVLAAMAELNYQPNIFARGLAGGQSMTVGVLTQQIGSPFYDAIVRGVIQGLAGSHYSPIFADGQWQADIEKEAVQTLLERRVDGLIVIGGHSPGELLRRLNEQLPVVVAARRVPELIDRCVCVDNFQAAYQAVRYLVEAGHEHIAHVTGIMTQPDGVTRRDGYVQALTDAGLDPNPALIVEGNFRRQSGVLAVETLLMRGQAFSAIFAANDQMAFGARLALFRRGIRVPDDVSIVGFDDQPDSAYMTPPLTTIRQPAVEMGETAAQFLLHLLKGKPFERPALSTELIIRESVARFR